MQCVSWKSLGFITNFSDINMLEMFTQTVIITQPQPWLCKPKHHGYCSELNCVTQIWVFFQYYTKDVDKHPILSSSENDTEF